MPPLLSQEPPRGSVAAVASAVVTRQNPNSQLKAATLPGVMRPLALILLPVRKMTEKMVSRAP